MPRLLRRRVRFVVLVDQAALETLPQETGIPTALDQGSQTARALGLSSGSLAVLERDGRIAWIQPELTPQAITTLGAIVADVLDGVDVPGRFRDQWNAEYAAYQRALREVAVRGN